MQPPKGNGGLHAIAINLRHQSRQPERQRRRLKPQRTRAKRRQLGSVLKNLEVAVFGSQGRWLDCQARHHDGTLPTRLLLTNMGSGELVYSEIPFCVWRGSSINDCPLSRHRVTVMLAESEESTDKLNVEGGVGRDCTLII